MENEESITFIKLKYSQKDIDNEVNDIIQYWFVNRRYSGEEMISMIDVCSDIKYLLGHDYGFFIKEFEDPAFYEYFTKLIKDRLNEMSLDTTKRSRRGIPTSI